jgi:hypothetical protein
MQTYDISNRYYRIIIIDISIYNYRYIKIVRFPHPITPIPRIWPLDSGGSEVESSKGKHNLEDQLWNSYPNLL